MDNTGRAYDFLRFFAKASEYLETPTHFELK